MIIDADKSVLGRVAAVAAKQALLGEEVKLVNCEKAVITGNRLAIIKRYLYKLELGQPRQGPIVQRRSDFFVRRVIRGMLPRKRFKGRTAFSRVKCFIGVPEDLKDKAEPVKHTVRENLKKNAYITVGELCKHLGEKR